MEPYATMSRVVYESQKPENIQGYKLVESPTKYIDVWRNSEGKVVIALVGTELSKGILRAIGDLATNAMSILGKIRNTARYKSAKSIVQKYSNVTLTGHSLGGNLAYVLGADFNIPSVTFNRPSYEGISMNRLISELKNPYSLNKNFSISGDVIGALGHKTDKLKEAVKKRKPSSTLLPKSKKGKSAHTIDQF